MSAASSGRTWLAIFGWLIGGALALWVVTILLILYTGSRPVIKPADAILVLGAAQYNGRPSPVFKARLDHALQLYHDGFAGMLVFTGGVGAGDTLSEGEVARRYAMRHNVPAEHILVERHGVTSAQSVAAAAAIMRAKGLRRALVVSDSYHMLRLELLARRAGIVPFRAPAASPIDRARRQRVRYVLRESALFPATVLLGGK